MFWRGIILLVILLSAAIAFEPDFLQKNLNPVDPQGVCDGLSCW